MLIWRNEATPGNGGSPRQEPPPGPVEITRTGEHGGNTSIWYAPVPARPAAAGMPAEPLTMLGTVAALHHECYTVWRAAGFTEDQAFELVKEVVAAAYRSG